MNQNLPDSRVRNKKVRYDLDNLLDEKFTYTGDGFVFTKRTRKVNGQGNHHIGMAQHAENDWD